MFRSSTLLALALCACNRGEAKPKESDKDDVADPWRSGGATADDAPCERLPFADELPIAEASGAVFLDDGLLVVADSGNDGAYVIVDPETGVVRSRGTLPLGSGASDDLEGISLAGDDTLWGVTSSGWMRAWRRDGDGFALIDGPYPLGGHLSCRGDEVNCGANLEGLCLAHTIDWLDVPVGFVASKADGKLYALQADGARFRDYPGTSIAITDPEALSDCAFESSGDAVWTGSNLFGGDLVTRVTGWRKPSTATVTELGSLGVGFPEVIAVGGRDNMVYRFSDTGGAPSLASRWNCGAR